MTGETDFGELLRWCRTNANLSQAELAVRSGLGIRTIRDLELGRSRRPRRDTTRLLTEAMQLDHDVRRAFERAARPQPPPPALTPAPFAAYGQTRLPELTGRERSVLELMAEGDSNEAIAERLGIGARTVETHVQNIFWKLRLVPGRRHDRRVLAVLAYLRLRAPAMSPVTLAYDR